MSIMAAVRHLLKLRDLEGENAVNRELKAIDTLNKLVHHSLWGITDYEFVNIRALALVYDNRSLQSSMLTLGPYYSNKISISVQAIMQYVKEHSMNWLEFKSLAIEVQIFAALGRNLLRKAQNVLDNMCDRVDGISL